MKFEITLEEAEEFACCIVDCNLNRDEACEYIKACLMEQCEVADNECLLIESK